MQIIQKIPIISVSSTISGTYSTTTPITITTSYSALIRCSSTTDIIVAGTFTIQIFMASSVNLLTQHLVTLTLKLPFTD